ncbi:MAG: DUF167 domain-containing protein [Deltaproteobacteria bacterium]|nr:DUF167 domain-containing protein [Deltaproteobacteria bacterium]
MPAWLETRAGGVTLRVFVKPRASRTRVVGEHEGELAIQLAAPPVDGAANDELTAFLAKTLGVARRQVELVGGDASRHKRLHVTGVDAAAAAAALAP